MSDHWASDEESTTRPQARPSFDLPSVCGNILAEIPQLQTVILSSLSKVTRLATVHALPLELLQQCFSALAQDDLPRTTLDGVHLGWITVSHVCRAWREAAMELSMLWGRPTLALGPRWFREMARRAGSAPLIVHCTWPYSPRPKRAGPFSPRMVRQTIIGHMDHLKELISEPKSTICYSGLVKALILPAHSLTTIELHAFPYGAPAPFSLPTNFLGQAAPRLRKISLHGITGQWAVSLRPFRDLLQLNILDVGPSLTSFDDLLHILGASPRLEELCLLGVLTSWFESAGSSRRLRLPHLQCLILDGYAAPCAELIQILDLPDTVRINLVPTYSSLDDWQLLFSALAQHFTSRLPFRRLSLIPKTFRFAMESAPYNANEPEHDLSTASSCPPLLYLECMDSKAHVIRAALGNLPYADLTELVIADRYYDRDLWTDNLRSLKQVRYLRIEGDGFHRLACAAIVDGAEKGVDLFPQLSFLELHHTNLSSAGPLACAALIAMLIRRKNLGSPIERFHLTRCVIPSQVVSDLAEVVPDIVEVK
ncbi:uncharacterized protein STEHIDRAFT_154270 [Stereum hirsutum FP-91666 SS1]|uniref:uncharacterized protein n=1 Tax=Stereum hirsutum (strain FP-91666) TaxID=721885 RepID=UPI000440AF2D|nr:uncharacterized protein STEHIDRAFT_154270 [Stereum hirsutum FP-91666 SS1]EIM90446.1 hypothetical protein STEHIDRAFT_154270 [Stereum hirsutum FP-91666 SS1]